MARPSDHRGTMSIGARVARRIRRDRDVAVERLRRGTVGRFVRDSVRLYPYVYGGPASRVRIAPGVVINDTLLNCASGTITIHESVFFGHGVSLLTGTHDVLRRGRERQGSVPRTGRDIVIEEGAWVASNATVLGPCRIGRHAVVAAGAVVTADVPAFAVVGGIPARIVATTGPDAQ